MRNPKAPLPLQAPPATKDQEELIALRRVARATISYFEAQTVADSQQRRDTVNYEIRKWRETFT